MNSLIKKQLGQYYTVYKNYILSDLQKGMVGFDWVEPFAGTGELSTWIEDTLKARVKSYDIYPRCSSIEYRDSLLNPLLLQGLHVITNPPYLARNKSDEKEIYERYSTDDLYKASIKMIMGYDIHSDTYREGCEGGILIVPLNFLSDRDSKLRREFFSRYDIGLLNIFEEQVFDDTTYTVCSFNFQRRFGKSKKFKIRFYPDYLLNPKAMKRGYHLLSDLGAEYKLGYQFLDLIKNKTGIEVSRLTDETDLNKYHATRLYLRAIDTGSSGGRIKLSLQEPKVGKQKDRTFAQIVVNQRLSKKQEELIVGKFNRVLEEYREKYHSLFLTNFRNSTKHYARKRISFSMAYDLVAYVIESFSDYSHK